MGYEDSAACKMLATHCSACGRPLVDAKSVEVGMGPDCREKYFCADGISETDRAEANALVYKIALLQKGPEVVKAANALQNMGFAALAARIAERLASIVVEENGEVLAVYTPYNEKAVAGWHQIPGRKWNKEKKANMVPVTSKTALLTFLKTYFKGSLGYGKKGFFTVA